MRSGPMSTSAQATLLAGKLYSVHYTPEGTCKFPQKHTRATAGCNIHIIVLSAVAVEMALPVGCPILFLNTSDNKPLRGGPYIVNNIQSRAKSNPRAARIESSLNFQRIMLPNFFLQDFVAAAMSTPCRDQLTIIGSSPCLSPR